ncbi:MAG: ABC transporter ATP-binding protein [Actinobacteria bacterium HGW-Actinobacteria-6]|jgi:branched-chain amino acid transport system ATP-binding protein|nr:MAG: ABC transporter ATP-binding protein [Actinobacteria bacterium HGW-Actinobacteria-6]
MPEVLLRVEGLDAGYGRVPVIRGASLEVMRGEIVTIIGANGAGKSTLLKTIAGLVRPTAGNVTLEDRDVTGLAPERLVRRGLALVPEARMLFGPMSVAENLALGAHTRRSTAEVADSLKRVNSLFPVLAERSSQPASTLSGGEQQMLAIARALMSNPRVLLLDEPSLGLAPKVIADIFGVLDDLRSEGLGILLVEQDANLALKHAQRGHVMRSGHMVLSGAASELADNDDVRLIYLGAWHGKE